MPKKEFIEVKGKVVEVLPNATFKIQINSKDLLIPNQDLDEIENNNIDDKKLLIMGHSSGKIRKHRIRILLHDIVTLEMTPYDLTKGRIIHREK